MKILLLSGGRSAERDVSLVSAVFVRKVLENAGHELIGVEIRADGSWHSEGCRLTIDTGHERWRLIRDDMELEFQIVFPVLHGPYGEDGTIQGFCMMAGWPYAGAGVMTSSVAMNKVTTKELLHAAGIPVLPWLSCTSEAELAEDSMRDLEYPVFVKPARMGSSVGISRVESPEGLRKAMDQAFRFDSLIVIEKGIENAREIEVALLSESGTVTSSVPGEIIPGLEWYDYEAKYSCEDSRLLIPAPIEPHLEQKIRSCAERSFELLQGSGFARADFLLDREDNVYFNEINTIPGFTEISMFPKLWEASGISAAEVMERIMTEALRRHSRRKSLKVSP